MASPRKLDFSSPSSSKKKNKSALFQRIWSEDDEIALLQGLIDYKVKPNSDWDAFIGFIGGSVVATKFSKEQIMSKVCKLKGKFRERMRKISKGHRVPLFVKPIDSQAFALSKLLWAPNVSTQTKTSHVCMYDELLTENQETQEELKDDEADAEDERCAVKDAFEALLLRELSEYRKKLRMEKVVKLRAGKRKELSTKWKKFCDEEAKMEIKRYRLRTELAEAIDGDDDDDQ
ncbi:unnamed protein product [Cochlearia groenlandica]